MPGFSIDVGAMQGVVHSPDGPVVRFLFLLGNRIRTNAAARCNVDTGRLRSSITVNVDTTTPRVTVGSDVEYALFVHEGTAPHLILPVRRKALSWVGPGGRVFATRVNHPGYRGNPFLRDAAEEEVGAL